jgi:golgi-specific brefeldin A-resistance guanine nucleotide exchange factor 1
MQAKSRKKLVLTGAARFNAKPKTGLAFLEENNIINPEWTPEMSRETSIATFLKSCTRLDKRLLGDFISKPENEPILKAFISLFDFKGVSTNRHPRQITNSICSRNTSLMPCESFSRASVSREKRNKYHG